MTDNDPQSKGFSIFHTKEMGLDPELFLFTLPRLVSPSITTINGDQITIKESELTTHIFLRPLSPRVLGPLTIPRTEVSFSFSPEDPDLIADFIRRFDFHFRRGGG
tara:strand:- start:309 stop:626 length:318 start_codon:yes stop_codon:yes gene_type:complete